MLDTLRLAVDTQHCIANNMPLNTTYGSLLFEDEDKEHVQSLFIFENLNIKPSKDKLLYTGNLSQLVLQSITDVAMKEVKKSSFHNSMCEIYNQMQQENKSYSDSILEESQLMQQIYEMIESEEEVTYRKPTKEEIKSVKNCQKLFKHIGLNTKLNISEEFISLEKNCEEINLNEEQLTYIVQATLEIFTTFCICPMYNEIDEEDEQVYGVRMFWGIDLREE